MIKYGDSSMFRNTINESEITGVFFAHCDFTTTVFSYVTGNIIKLDKGDIVYSIGLTQFTGLGKEFILIHPKFDLISVPSEKFFNQFVKTQ